MPISQAQVGPLQATDGTITNQRSGNQGDSIVSQLHAHFYEQTYRKAMFAVCNQAAVTTTAGLATTYTGLVVGNPVGSGVNMVINRFGCAQVAAGAAAAIGIMTGQSTTAITDTLVTRNRFVGQVRSKCVANAGQTIGTPVLEAVFGSLGSVATTGYGLQQSIIAPIEGALIVPPGFFVAAYTSAVTTSALIFNFLWEEVPQ